MPYKLKILAILYFSAAVFAATPLLAENPSDSSPTIGQDEVTTLLKTLENTYSTDYCPRQRICPDPRRDKIINILDQLKGRDKGNACTILKQVSYLISTRWNHILVLGKALEVLEEYYAAASQDCRDGVVSSYGKFLEKEDKQNVAKLNSALQRGGHSPSVWDFATDDEVAQLEKRFEQIICSKPLKSGLKKWEYVVQSHSGLEIHVQQVVCEAKSK